MKSIKKESLKIGSDPEVFIAVGNTPISAVGYIPGTKREPFKIDEDEYVQLDNVAMEFNVKPSSSADEFISSLQKCYDWAQNHLRSINPHIQLYMEPSAIFNKSELMTKEAMTFGCEPDFNAWEDGAPNRPPRGVDPCLRSCGGHIHLGFEDDGNVDACRLVRLLDKNVGIYTARICGDERRRSLYGKAGAFRPKPYGLEYRTPSISWLKSEEYIRSVFELVNLSIDEYNEGMDASKEVQETINNTQYENAG